MIWKVKYFPLYQFPLFYYYSFAKLTIVAVCPLFLLSGKLYFIDFEYGSYSYRGYDIANHFNEYAGFDCDYNL
jgi:thiamine kinase-like enzyme